MLAFGYGITFDIENLKYAAFDQDQTPESRRLLEGFSGSRYFSEQPPISSAAELEQRMRSGELAVVVEIPPGFGRDLANRRSPEVALLDRRRHAVPRRDDERIRHRPGVAICAGSRGRAPWPERRIQRLPWRRQYRKSLPLQPGFQERLRHGAERHRDDADPDPGNHVGDRCRAREGNRLDRQFSLDAHQQIRVPARQAAPLCRRRNADLHLLAADGVFRVPRAGQRIVRSPRARGVALRLLDLRLRATHLVLHPDTGRGSLCDHRSSPSFRR